MNAIELNNIEKIRSLSQVYFPSAIRSLIGHSKSANIESRIVKHKDVIISKNKTIKFSEFLSRLYSRMLHTYRNEYIFKNTIINELWLGKHQFNNSTLLRELKIGKSVADLVFINGGVSIYEIKTNLDNLDRLESQLKDYKKVIEKIYIVTDSTFVDELIKTYKHKSYGIIELTKSEKLKIHKEAKIDKKYFKHDTLFKLLRKDEYVELIKIRFGIIPGVPNTQLFKTCLRLIKEIEIVEFQKLVFQILRNRKVSNPEFLLSRKTPFELKYACYSLDLSNKQYSILYDVLNKRI
ncbi:MAG: sce7726 family protein [Bacteroidota bacterium]|nr:sce7726 family protein [Bacteroidota bacterium]